MLYIIIAVIVGIITYFIFKNGMACIVFGTLTFIVATLIGSIYCRETTTYETTIMQYEIQKQENKYDYKLTKNIVNNIITLETSNHSIDIPEDKLEIKVDDTQIPRIEIQTREPAKIKEWEKTWLLRGSFKGEDLSKQITKVILTIHDTSSETETDILGGKNNAL